jgi:hypothetical protein
MGSEQVPVPAKFVMFLGIGKQAHENQSRYDTSGDDFLCHGCLPSSGPTRPSLLGEEQGQVGIIVGRFVTVEKQKGVRAATERLISATAGSRPVPSLRGL